MGLYGERILPWLINRGMRNAAMARHRPGITAAASGRVLELGAGAGLNFVYYPAEVTHLFALEPADSLRLHAARLAHRLPFPLTLLGSSAESIPLESASVDTVLSTWTLCSVTSLETALAEARRVLRPGGKLLFLDHGRASEPGVARRQDQLAPLMHRVVGCHPNRRIDQAIEEAGFRFEKIDRRYLRGPRFLAWHFMGMARPR